MLLPGVENYRKLRCPEILTAVPGPPEVSWTEFTSQQPSFHIEVHIFSSITHKKFKMDKIRQILKMFKWVILEFTPSFSDRSFRSFSMDEHTALPSSVLNFRTQSLFSSFSFPISSIVPLPGAKAVIKDSPFIDAGLVLCCQNTTNGHNCKRQSPTSFQDLL
nr:hypothetical protein Iba_chr12cCG3030 [Ipomoea batatas]